MAQDSEIPAAVQHARGALVSQYRGSEAMMALRIGSKRSGEHNLDWWKGVSGFAQLSDGQSPDLWPRFLVQHAHADPGVLGSLRRRHGQGSAFGLGCLVQRGITHASRLPIGMGQCCTEDEAEQNGPMGQKKCHSRWS